MSLTLRVLAPDQNVFDGSADEVILPSTTGQLGILPGHISLLTAIDVGVLRVRANGGWNSIALMGGFAEVDADEVTVLVNQAELGSTIDGNAAEADFQKATTLVDGERALEGGVQGHLPDKNRQIGRLAVLQAAQKCRIGARANNRDEGNKNAC